MNRTYLLTPLVASYIMVITVPLAKLQYLHTRYSSSGTNSNPNVTLPSLIS